MKKSKNFKTFLYLILLFFFVLNLQTIVYSAINGTMRVSGDAMARVEADARITDFRLATTNNATSSFEEFGKSHIVTEVDLKDTSSFLTYHVEITNYGTSDIGILDIAGLPSGVNYSIKDYNLKDKVCDDKGKCNTFIKKTLELTLTTTSTYQGNVQLNFNIQPFYKVSYNEINIDSSYPMEILGGDTLSITFIDDLKRVSSYGYYYDNNGEAWDEEIYHGYISSGQTITLEKVASNIIIWQDEPQAKLVSGNINTPGSEICIGEECFYLLSNDGTKIEMLSKYNLHVGNQSNDGTTPVELDNPTGIQDSTAKGFTANQLPYIGTTPFSSSTHQGANASDYNGSIVEEYVYDYANYLQMEKGVEIMYAGIPTIEILNELGCDETIPSCSNAPSWVYSTSYWTASPYDNNHVWNVSSRPALGYNGMDYRGYLFGVRPVIGIRTDEVYDPYPSGA